MDKYKLLARAEKKVNANSAAIEESKKRMGELNLKFHEATKLVEVFAAVMWQAAKADDMTKTLRALDQLKVANIKVEEYARRMCEETKTGTKLLLKDTVLNLVWDILDGANKAILYPHYIANKALFHSIANGSQNFYYNTIITTKAVTRLQSLPAHALMEIIKRKPAPPTANKYIQ